MGVQLFHGLCCFRRSFIFRCVVSHSTVSVVSRSRRYHARILGDRAHAVLFWIEFFNVKSCSRGRLGVLPLHSASEEGYEDHEEASDEDYGYESAGCSFNDEPYEGAGCSLSGEGHEVYEDTW